LCKVFVDGDAAPLDTFARALHRLQAQVGIIPSVRSKGHSARRVLQRLLEVQREESLIRAQSSTFAPLNLQKDIDALFIIDR